MNLIFFREKIYLFIQKELKKHPKLYYLQWVWRHRNEEKIVSQVMMLNRNPNVLEIERFGNKNPKKNIYFIDINGNNAMGFAAYLKQTIFGVFEAEYLGFVPVVYYNPSGCLYAEAEPVNGTKNPFEYYFEQVSDISVAEVYESARVFLFSPFHGVRIEYELGNPDPYASSGYFVSEDYIAKMARVFKKYIRLVATVRNQISEDMNGLISNGWQEKKILGVHLRGTDYALKWAGHPNMVTTDEFIVAIDEVLSLYDYEYVFLATDDKKCLDALIEKYGSKLIYYKDVARGAEALNTAMVESARPRHHYLNGLEVVRDMYTLARCDALVCSRSQVSTLARTIRLAEAGPYKHLKVLDKGIYQG